MFRAVAQDDPFQYGDGSVRSIRDSIDGSVWTGGGRDVLIGGAGPDHIDAGASTNNDDLHLKAQWFDEPMATQQLGKLKWENIKDFPIMPDSDFGDGKDDIGTYQPDTVDTDLSLSTADTGGIPVSMAEYALLLF